MIVRNALLAVIATACAAPGGGSDARPPHVVLIVADDLGWRDPAFMGSDYHRTPNLDRLAAEGLRFEAAYACGPNCAPSRAALFSGQYAPRTGVYTVNSSARGRAENRRLLPVENRTELAPEVVTLAEVLAASGYRTAFVGKWHLGEGERSGPRAQGFEVAVAGNRAGHPASYESPYSNPDLADGPPGEYLTTRLTDEAIAVLESRDERPLFVCLSYYSVHTPIQPRADHLEALAGRPRGELHKNRRYAAMVEGLDHEVGRLLAALEREDLARETVVVFTSDNGGVGRLTSMAPLRGAKGMLYEGGVRVPLVVRWPGRVPAGGVTDEPVIGVDLFPTLAGFAGARLPAGVPLDGVDLAPLILEGRALAARALFWHFPAYLEAAAGAQGGPWRTTPVGALREGDLKLIENFEDGRLELYDLHSDPGESRDLAAQRAEDARRLHELMRAWRADIGAALPSVLP